MRWARIALCTLALSTTVGLAAPGRAGARTAGGPAVALVDQTPWVTPSAPWFNLSVGVSRANGSLSGLAVDVTIFSRIETASQLQQDTGTTPDKGVLTTVNGLPVTATAGGGLATTCITVLPDDSATAPAVPPGTPGTCPAGGPTVILGCTPDNGTCPDVYPVSVALVRRGSSNPLGRFTTFLTYQEPLPVASTGPLQVAWVVPVSARPSPTLSPPSGADRRSAENLVGLLTTHGNVPLTLAASPQAVSDLASRGGRKGRQTVEDLADLSGSSGGDQLLAQPYVPINPAALAAAGLGSDVRTQMDRGSGVLHQSHLHPAAGTWVDAASSFSSAQAGALATGLHSARADHLVVDDTDLAPAGSDQLTFAQPFTLALGHGRHIMAAAANSQADSRFTADAGNPTLAATQLLATLEFFHFENTSLFDNRGVIITPPPGWQASGAFVNTLLTGLTDNPALSAVTLDQFFAQVPVGGNGEPTVRHLQQSSAPAPAKISRALAGRIAGARTNLSSFAAAALGDPPTMTDLSDLLLTTESDTFDPAQRTAALNTYSGRFDGVLHKISLAAERTVTFTSRTAPIPVSVLNAEPFTVKVVMSLSSDKFNFPNGASRTLTLRRPTTPVRVQARSRTSGDRLPVQVTLTTPDGRLTIARVTLTVHSTSISVVGIGLTVLAGLVLLVWWARTWRRGRRRPRPRARAH